MNMLLVTLIGEQLGHALLLYPVIWFFVRKKNRGPFSIKKFSWHLAGYIATGIGAGFIQFHAISVVGINGVLDPQNLVVEGIYIVVLPSLFAFGCCHFIKNKTGYYSAGEEVGPA